MYADDDVVAYCDNTVLDSDTSINNTAVRIIVNVMQTFIFVLLYFVLLKIVILFLARYHRLSIYTGSENHHRDLLLYKVWTVLCPLSVHNCSHPDPNLTPAASCGDDSCIRKLDQQTNELSRFCMSRNQIIISPKLYTPWKATIGMNNDDDSINSNAEHNLNL